MTIFKINHQQSNSRFPADTHSFRLLVACTIVFHATSPVATAEDHFPVRNAVNRALHQVIGETVLGKNHRALAQKIDDAAPEKRYQQLKSWVLPNEYRDTIRLAVSLSTENGVQSPVLDLVALAAQLGRTEELRTSVRNAAELPENVRAAAAILFLAEFAVNPDSPTADAISALENFVAKSRVRDVSIGKLDWPLLLVMSEAAYLAQVESLLTDLLAPYYAERGSFFLKNPTKEAFFDRIRWLDGCRTFATTHGGKRGEFCTPPKLKNWITTEYRNAGTHGRGAPKAHWQIIKDGVTKLGGHEMDYLMYRQPLHGDYVVEFDASAHSMSVVLAGVGMQFDRRKITYGVFRHDWVREAEFDPPLSEFNEWNRFRAVVQDDVLNVHINGRSALSVVLPPQNDSWFGVRSWRRWRGTIRNFRITGDPIVPKQIRISDDQARNWTSYFEAGNWNAGLEPGENGEKADPGTIYGGKQSELAGTFSESLFRYLRPLSEDGMIDYEFYYKNGEYLVHPALDRMCFVMTAKGVGIHTLTDQQYDQAGADPASRRFDNSTLVRNLPLINDAWNRMQVFVKGNIVSLMLNGTSVFTTDISPDNDHTFGLFHYSDQTVAKVRNVVWHGDWETEIPDDPTQQIRNVTVDEINERSSELTASFHHDFRNGVPSDLFDFSSLKPAGVEANIQQVDSGVRIHRRPAEGQYEITANLQIQGDFDIRARFSSLKIQKTAKGHAGIGLWLRYDSESLDDGAIYRRQQDKGGEKSDRLQQAHKWMARDGRHKFRGSDFPEESKAGCLRLARRGRDVYYMYAEADSENFRVIRRVEITDADTKANGVGLVMQAVGNNETTVTWESISIRAEGFRNHWPDERSAADIIRRLDERRTQLTPSKIDLTDEASTREKITGLPNESNGTFTASGLRVTTTNRYEFPRVVQPMERCVDVEAHVDIHQIDAPTELKKSNEVALQLFMNSEYLHHASIMLRRKASGGAVLFCQTRESNIGKRSFFWPLRSLQVTQLKRMRLAILDDTLYFLYSETVDGPYKLLAEHPLRDVAKPQFLHLRSGATGEGSTTDVTWKTVSLFESGTDNRPVDSVD